ncbi:MAG: S8 family serine peptidase [Thermoanaerobaculum sp.]|nr:S8 family serine peptidase [Thermoanaerobaculum sp.]
MPLLAVALTALVSAGSVPAEVAPVLWTQAQEASVLELLVLLRRDTPEASVLRVPQWEREAQLVQLFPELAVAHLRVPSAFLPDLAADPRVAAVSPLIRVRAFRREGRSLIRVGQVHTLGWEGRGVGVAILDTGVDASHPELSPGGVSATAKTVMLFDAVGNDQDPRDEEGHGTAVAGIAAGKDGGVAPQARLVAVRVLDAKGEGSSAQVAAGLEAVLASVRRGNPYNIRVANLSLGGYESWWPPGVGSCDEADPVMARVFRQLTEAGVLVVAAGNGGCSQGVAWPACFSTVLAVGAVYDDELCFDPLPLPFGCLLTSASFGEGQCLKQGCTQETKRDRITCYSDSGEKLGVWAPSHCARTTKRGGGYEDCFGGTSAAAPYVAGVAALLTQAYPFLLPAAIRTALEQSGTPRTDARNNLTRQRVDAQAALQFLTTYCPQPQAPVGVSVSRGSLCGAQALTMTWAGSPGASRYRVQVSFFPDFAEAAEHLVGGTSATVSAPPGQGTRMYLRVRAERECGAFSAWGASASVAYSANCERTPRRRLSPPR